MQRALVFVVVATVRDTWTIAWTESAVLFFLIKEIIFHSANEKLQASMYQDGCNHNLL